MNNPSVEEIDLAALARALRRRLGELLDRSYLDGRTLLRDMTAEEVGCSALEAEELIDTLESMGYVRFPRLSDDTHSVRVEGWWIAG